MRIHTLLIVLALLLVGLAAAVHSPALAVGAIVSLALGLGAWLFDLTLEIERTKA